MKKFVFVLMMSLSSLGATASDFAFREGDIVFRSGRNYPVMYISGSTITHCGIIVNTPSGLRVLEADGRVKLHTIEEFFGKNIKKAEIFTRRVTNKRVRIDYSRYLGKKNDNQFSLNNDAYYCSELVYVIYRDQLGMELCTPRPLCRHNVFGLKWLLRKRGIDVNQLVVTPADLFKDYLK